MKNVRYIALLLASLAATAARADAAEKFGLETGMAYTTGKYGGARSTEMVYVPFTARYQVDAWSLKLTVPYLRITGPASAINLLNGVSLTGTAADAAPVTRSGLGDVQLSATRNAYNGGESGLVLNVTGKVKLGTASSSEGLGTGKNDYAAQSELFRVQERATTFGTLGYRVHGSPAGYSLRNVFYGSLGGSYKFDQALQGGAMLNLGQKATATGSQRMETIFFLNRRIDNAWKAQGYVLKGYTNAVPDWGVGATVTYLL
ncbi:MAG TPA: hypothetical protein VGD24_06795 [Gallionella sp.]